MELFKDNIEFWNELKRKGWLYSVLKDGKPKKPRQKLLGFAYPIIMIAIALIGLIITLGMSKRQRKLKSLIFVLVISCPLGWVWNIWMQKVDPTMPGWLFAPWGYIGREWLLTIEDFIFYPGCSLLFYIFFRKVHLKGTPWTRNRDHWIIVAIYCVMTAFFLILTSIAGRSEAAMFAVPGILMYIYARDRIDIRKFLIFQVIVIGFEATWDYVAVSLIHIIPGMAWASQWTYITFDQTGHYVHSNIYLDYGTHRWAWILNNPIEITPWYGIVGGIFNYGIIATADKLFYPVSRAES